MNKREKRYTACISIMTILLVGLIMVACSGCTTYKVKTIRLDGTKTELDVTSWRDLEGVTVLFSRKGEDVKFKFGAASVTSKTPADAVLKGVELGIQIATGRPAASNEQE